MAKATEDSINTIGRDSQSTYERLASINVSSYIEKKNNLSYLSWSWAIDQLLRQDPNASWHYHWFEGKPYCVIGDTAMVFCTVSAFGIERTAQLPVMDYKMKSVPLPIDSSTLNTSMMRALAKAVALHGLGLYIFSGEDTPLEVNNEANSDTTIATKAPSIQAKATSVTSPSPIKASTPIQLMGDNEIKTIKELAKKTGVNELVIAKAYKVNSLNEIPLAKAQQIIAKLQEKAIQLIEKTEEV
jgi:hypothetical protein